MVGGGGGKNAYRPRTFLLFVTYRDASSGALTTTLAHAVDSH